MKYIYKLGLFCPGKLLIYTEIYIKVHKVCGSGGRGDQLLIGRLASPVCIPNIFGQDTNIGV